MSGPGDRRDLERFRTVVLGLMGLRFDDARLGLLDEVLKRRLDHLGRSSDAYLNELESMPSPNEIGALASELTVCETYFFRNGEQFRALAEIALPERMRARETQRELRLLSAGCASGEEAYSIAIVAQEVVSDPGWNVLIRAIDINPVALAKAAAARYSSWALRDMPRDKQRQWFRAEGRDMRLNEGPRRAVRFDIGNLVTDDPTLWPAASYDVIFCRNVLMYFSPEQMRLAIERIARSLVPDGFLFLGHAETLRGVSDAFHLRHTHGTFYYQRAEHAGATALPTREWEMPRAPVAVFDESWVETVRAATERVAALVPLMQVGAPPRRTIAWDPTPALDLLRGDRFSDALDHLRGRPPESEDDPDTLLLEAALLAQSGQLAAAEIAGRRLIRIDEQNAGAHYVLALCREADGDREGASGHDQIAAWLDPSFAMPRLHLGLLARRARDAETARNELEQALILLKREEASRILLFGGGFNREALIALCRSALKECGDRPRVRQS